MKHAPGPWSIDKRSELNTIIMPAVNSTQLPVCRLGILFTDDVQNANAHLIAAAPELLTACKAAREWLGERPSADDSYYRAVKNLIDKLDAAIAKADGRDW